MSDSDFTWRDDQRTVYFRDGVIGDSLEILASHGLNEYELLTTERAMGAAPIELAEDADCFHHVPPGPVNEVAARLIEDVGPGDLVALGGGRVIDVAKAIAAVREVRVAALPTTLSGAEMTRIHRLPEGYDAPHGLTRPDVVLADPPVMTTLAEERLRASAMNALGHAADSLVTPLANPASQELGLRAASLIAKALDAKPEKRDPATLALGSIFAGYAIDSAMFALHHVVCQTLVRTLRIPHAETNATMLPHTMEALRGRASKQMTALARALKTTQDGLFDRLVELGGGLRRLSQLGDAERTDVNEAVKAMVARPELQMTPDPPDADELRRLIETAW